MNTYSGYLHKWVVAVLKKITNEYYKYKMG
jgi:hypothetical protein